MRRLCLIKTSQRNRVAATMASICIAAFDLQALGAASRLKDENRLFPASPVVKRQATFWEDIFYKYPSTTVIVHDVNEPGRIIDVIDYKTILVKGSLKSPVPRRIREDVTQKYLKRYSKAVDRFVALGKGATRHGAIEERVYDVYKNSPKGLRRLFRGDVKIRAQTGLADDFRAAATTAKQYLPYMESVFKRYGVPVRLTRLPFVESMFNLKARSKVGASGIWQFMPDTAKNFLFVNQLIDERNSPFKETRAAAELLLSNYRTLGSWPLAITAYNHGAMGLLRAVKETGTDDLSKIIESYESPSFGFASKNFYSEFLAAVSTYEKLERSQAIREAPKLPETAGLILTRPTSVADILNATKLSSRELQEFNPCLLDAALTTHRERLLPAYYELRLPSPISQFTRLALQKNGTVRYATK